MTKIDDFRASSTLSSLSTYMDFAVGEQVAPALLGRYYNVINIKPITIRKHQLL